jgi:hypothetical protein
MAHIVHHQSEDYNLTVSARITVFQAILRHGFWLVLPLLGFKADMIITILLVHGLYPFFVHTRLVGKLGILEYILVTPSHHRVHHASNPGYLDKNYGDVLIIWDKLFGTFQKEEEEPVYGLTKPLKTHSFLWQHFHFFIELWLAVKKEKGGKQKLKVLFGPPETVDPTLRGKAEAIFNIYANENKIEKPLNRYVVWQIILLLLSLTIFTLYEHYFSLQVKIAFSFFTILTLINCGAIMEKRRWVFYMEYIRLVVVFYLPFSAPGFWALKLAIAGLTLALITLYYQKLQRKYYRYILSS